MRLIFLVFMAWGMVLAGKSQLAVMPLEPKGIPAYEAELLSESLIGHLQSTGNFQVIERTQVSLIMAEQGFQQSGACDGGTCAVEVGRLLSADCILVGSVGMVGNLALLNLRVVDVGNGMVLAQSQRESASGTPGLLANLNGVAAELAGLPIPAARALPQVPHSQEDPVMVPVAPVAIPPGSLAIVHLLSTDSSKSLAVHRSSLDYGLPRVLDTRTPSLWNFDINQPETLTVTPPNEEAYSVPVAPAAGEWDLLLPAAHTDSAWLVYLKNEEKASGAFAAFTTTGISSSVLLGIAMADQQVEKSRILLACTGTFVAGILLGKIAHDGIMGKHKKPPEDRVWQWSPHVGTTRSGNSSLGLGLSRNF